MFEHFKLTRQEVPGGFLKVKVAHTSVWAAFLLYMNRTVFLYKKAAVAGSFTCLFFRYKNAVLNMHLRLSLLYDIGFEA